MSATASTGTAPDTVGPHGDASVPGVAARLIATGAVLGPAWTASLRS